MTDSLEIIVPVRNMRSHIAQCVASLVPQLDDRDRLTVVDDGSDDGSPQAAEAAGAQLIRLDRARGPYAARQLAAGRSHATNLLFIDARGRARPGLLAAHRELLSREAGVLSCTNVRIVAGSSFASQVAAESKLFDVAAKVGVPGRLDFFPTCNLGVERRAFLAVGGFRQMRSGGDIDLCWRVQLAGLGGMHADHRALLDWIPRDSFRALIEQSYRYGKSAARMQQLYPAPRAERSETVVTPAPRDFSNHPITGYLRRTTRQSIGEPRLVANRATGRSLALLQAASQRWAAGRPESAEVPALIPLEG